jgi:hypothetical protein
MYARHFGGYRYLKSLERKDYMMLTLLLKKKLLMSGYRYLPQVITANLLKLNRRVIRNEKFLSKLERSTTFQELTSNKFKALEYLGKDDTIIRLISTLINSTFGIVEFESPDLLGETLEVAHDTMSDEILMFLTEI